MRNTERIGYHINADGTQVLSQQTFTLECFAIKGGLAVQYSKIVASRGITRIVVEAGKRVPCLSLLNEEYRGMRGPKRTRGA